MQDLIEELAQRGMSLSPHDRARLAERLLDSLYAPSVDSVESVWNDEIEKRVAAHRGGEVEVFEAEEVFAEARRLAP